jgi:hypothetical protein
MPRAQVCIDLSGVRQNDAAFGRQAKGREVSLSLPIRNEHKAADRFDERLVAAPLNPLLICVMVDPYDAGPVVIAITPWVIDLQVDPLKLTPQSVL